MGTIREKTAADGTKRFLAIVRMKGAPELTRQFRTRTEAKKWIVISEGGIREGRNFPKPESTKRTFAEVCDRYAEDVLPQKAESTQASQRGQLAWFRAELGHLVLRDVTTPALDEVLRKRSKMLYHGKAQGPATMNRWLALLTHVMGRAVRWGWIDDNAAERLPKHREAPEAGRVLEPAELTRLLDACRTSRAAHLHPVTVLAIATGARLGELLGLRWSDVDFKAKRLVFRDTKNGETRAANLTAAALVELRQWSKATVRRLDDDRVFPATSNFQGAWKRARDRAGLGKFRFHDLRHTATTYMAEAGLSDRLLQEFTGHKSTAMLKRYAHLTHNHVAEAAERMSARVFGRVEE